MISPTQGQILLPEIFKTKISSLGTILVYENTNVQADTKWMNQYALPPLITDPNHLIEKIE